MRPITAKATPAAPSAMVCLDPWNGPALGVQVSPIGGATFTIDYSFDDPNDLVSPVPLGSMFWDSSFCPAGAIGGSTGVTFAIPTAPIWMRVRLLNAQGSVRATFTQLQSPLGGVGASSPPPPTREYAIALPDAGDSITMGNILDWDANQAWTCFGPVEITAHTTAFGQVIFTNCNTTYGAPTAGYELWLDESNSGLLRVRIMADYFANHFIDVQGSTNLIDFGPAFVVATYDGSRTAAGVKIYVNGVPETLAVILDALGAATIKTNGQNFIVGNQFSTVDVILGKMFFFQMENVALSPSVIATYSLDNRPPVTATTVLSLPFTEGTGNIAHDASTNAFEGAITSVLPMLSGAAVATSVAMTVPSGATVAVAIFAATGASLVVGDNEGNVYTPVPNVASGGGFDLTAFVCANITNAPTTLTCPNATIIYVQIIAGLSGVVDGSAGHYAASGTQPTVTFPTTANGDTLISFIAMGGGPWSAGGAASITYFQPTYGNMFEMQAQADAATEVFYNLPGSGASWLTSFALKPASYPNAWVNP